MSHVVQESETLYEDTEQRVVSLPEKDEELADLRRKLRVLEQDLERVTLEKQALSEVLDGVLQSKSWKLTSFLRRSMKALKSVFPLIRFGKKSLAIEGFQDVDKNEAGEFSITGPGPQMKLTTATAIPHGWCTFSGKLSSGNPHQHFFLYWDDGSGFQGDRRILLLLERERINHTMVKLPVGTRALRLDPFDTDGSFSFDSLSAKELGSLQFILFLFNKHIAPQLKNPVALFYKLKKVWGLYREGGLLAIKIRLFSDELTSNYQEWTKRYDTLTADDEKKAKALLNEFSYTPTISLITPVYNVDEKYLRECIESVQKQWYPHWELCLADDASTEPHIKRVLDEYAETDSRIKVLYREDNGHISKASNSALSLATGEYIALLDNDDVIRPHALFMVVESLQKNRDVKFIYSDEDKITSLGMRFNPYFKSGWNPTLLLTQNYICHFTVIRKDIVDKIQGFREGFEGAQDWDLILRSTEGLSDSEIKHIPHVLYHWRVIEGSTAQSTGFKPYVLEAQKKSVEEHLERKGVEGAEVLIREDIAQLRVNLPIPEPNPLVTMIIPTKDAVHLLSTCVDSILEKTSYRSFEIIIVDNGSERDETFEYFHTFDDDERVRIIRDEGPFNFSKLNNRAVEEAKGEYIALINNDLEVIEPDWLSELLSYAVLEENGVVGARLLFPNNLNQHAGIILGIGGVAGHSHKGQLKESPGYFNRVILPQNLSAITAACFIVKKSIYREVGGLDEDTLSVAFNDVDFCLKVAAAGYKNVYNPYALLYHYESATRGYETTPTKFRRFEQEIATMKDRWGDLLSNDPYYNPNLTITDENFSFAFPPRKYYPWKK